MNQVASDRRPSRKRWALIAAALVVLALAAAGWYVWRMRQLDAHDAQLARLQAAREREKGLVADLAALPADPAACPPGQILQRAAAPRGATGSAHPALPGSGP